MTKKYDSTEETQEHIKKVRELLDLFVVQLLLRGNVHDKSKLTDPEKEIFDKFTPMLRDVDYMSTSYQKYLAEMKPALDHHYAENRHHPQHYKPVKSKEADILSDFLYDETIPKQVRTILEKYIDDLRSPINRMNFLDVVEMLADWVASSQRHSSGNPVKSIATNQKRFHISEQLRRLMLNTLAELWNSE